MLIDYVFSRGMKFENVSMLVDTIAGIADEMRFSW